MRIVPLDQLGEVPQPTLQSLPDELFDVVLELLPRRTLFDLSLTSRWGYSRAVGHIWKDVELVDRGCWRQAPPGRNPPATLNGEDDQEDDKEWSHLHPGQIYDDHDETPMLKKLFVLATNPFVASKVRSIIHRCHLPALELFQDLPAILQEGLIHSRDFLHDHRRNTLSRLILQAVANMDNVHTLKILSGHWAIVETLLWGFFGPSRKSSAPVVPVRKLWLESCSLVSYRYEDLWHRLDFSQLESLRMRRMWLQYNFSLEYASRCLLARGTSNRMDMRNQTAGFYTVSFVKRDEDNAYDSILRLLGLRKIGTIYTSADWPIPEMIQKYQHSRWWKMGPSSYPPVFHTLMSSSVTLTSLCLDWLMCGTFSITSPAPAAKGTESHNLIQYLNKQRFPNLRAFQLRNAISKYAALQERIWLLDSGCTDEQEIEDWKKRDMEQPFPPPHLNTGMLDFMEAHSNLRCLAWPMDAFFPPEPSSPAIADRIRNVITNLGRSLVDLRVDAFLTTQGEPMTDDQQTAEGVEKRVQRRRFISEFAAEMRAVQSIKVEGGIPRDEKREIARALRHCPLSKLVFIGASFPLANTWGPEAIDLLAVDDGGTPYLSRLDAEDEAAIEDAVRLDPTSATTSTSRFRPSYGWTLDSLPMLYTIAQHHCDTIRLLKFCGYSGCPVLQRPTPITHPLIHHLKYFKELRELVMSFWLLTFYDQAHRDDSVIKYWLEMRKPTSKALVALPGAGNIEDGAHGPDEDTAHADAPDAASDDLGLAARITSPSPDGASWLYNSFHPDNLAKQVAKFIGPHLAKEAKERPGGVRVRASFCLGIYCQDIFDFDVRIGTDDKVLDFVGPREDSWEGGRSEDKLKRRRWF
ncbi:hypothetical protein NA57DRAFT_31310 [Rhizodiscina lignyota]|uniref:F-box domain-containing protein n=1 Tax=Rhizodiscina lignyota TaxID=1504668 RepID=A0A9P4IRL3_9PEZI|nr:hypothetical protein NA57DRAFT_31310 [Rhizodiscina lignyota]